MPSVKPKPPFTRSSFASGDTSASSAGSSRRTVGFSPCASAPAAQPSAASAIAEKISACLMAPPCRREKPTSYSPLARHLVDPAAALEHLYKIGEAPGSCFGFLRRLQPEED